MGSPRDVLIVGGGPAGARAARVLAEGGASVTLLEKARPPRLKVCGGGLVGRAAARVAAELGTVSEGAFHEVELNLVDSGMRFRVERPEPLMSCVTRAEFDHALLDAAAAAGAEVRAPEAALDLRRESGEIAITTESDSLLGRAAILADGALSPLSRCAGWKLPLETVGALEWELSVDPDTFECFAARPRFDIGALERGYSWVFPKREHLSVGALSFERRQGLLRPALEAWLEDIGLGEPRAVERHGFVIPVRPRAEGFTREGVLLAGDAAGLVDPVTCEGISGALISGELAARALLEGNLDPQRCARLYTRSLETELLRDLRIARRLARLLYQHPRLRDALFRRFGQGLAEAVAEVVAGRTGYRAALLRPRNWLKLLRGGARS